MSLNLLFLKALRDLKRSWLSFGACSLMVAVAVSLFLAFSSASRNLEKSGDETYQQLRFLDFYLSLRSVDASAVQLVQSIPGVKTAIGRRVVLARIVLNNDQEANSRVIGEPVGTRPEINDLFIHEGHYLQNVRGEAMIERRFAAAHNIHVGDRIRLKQRYSAPSNFTVVALVSSPEFIWLADDRLDPRPAARRLAIVFVSQADACTLSGEQGYNEIHARLSDQTQLASAMREANHRLRPDLLESPVARADQASHSLLIRDRRAFAGVAVLFPLVFLSLATVMLQATLWQLVVGQRKLIGVMMSNGISGAAIVQHYLFLCCVVAGLGGLIGIGLGQPLGMLCTRFYADSLGLPLVVTAFYPFLCGLGFSVILLAAILTGWGATYRLLTYEPARVMRVEFAPVQRVPRLERWIPALAGLSYVFRLPMRNVMRNPVRNLAVLCSLAFSVALLLMTLSFYDSEHHTLDFFFSQVHRYDLQIDLVQPTSPSSLPPVALWPGVHRAEFFLRQPMKIKPVGGGKEIERGVWGIPPDSQLVRIYSADRKPLEIKNDDVVLLGPLLLNTLKTRLGSLVRFHLETPQQRNHDADLRVGPALFEPVANPPKLTLARLQNLMAAGTEHPRDGVNIILLKVDRDATEAVRNRLYSSPFVAEITDFAQFREDVQELLRLANGYFFLMAIFSGLLAFALLVASSTMTVADRTGEIATLAVLGLSERTLAAMLVVETLIIWAGSILLGVPGGFLLGNWLLNHYQADLIQMQLNLSLTTIGATTIGSLVLCMAATVWSLRAVLRIPLSDATRSAS